MERTQVIKLLIPIIQGLTKRLDSHLGSSPVSSLGVIPDNMRETQTRLLTERFTEGLVRQSSRSNLLDSIVRSETNPVRDGLVLLLSDRKGSLGSERLLGRLL
jgi:hypothetical protein